MQASRRTRKSLSRSHTRRSALQLADHVLQHGAKFGRYLGIVYGESHIRGEEAKPRATIIGLAVEADAVERLAFRERLHAIGQLDLAARSLFHLFKNLEDFRRKHIAPGNDEIGRRC